jgi:hypothetical protein
MLNILQEHSVYRSQCTDSVDSIVEMYLQLYERYITEYANGDNYRDQDFQVGTFVLHHVYTSVLTSTLNAEVAYKIGIVAILYYIEFINQISRNVPTPGVIRAHPLLGDEETSENTTEITYNDVIMFVYSKTLSNIISHLIKGTSSLNFTVCHYFFRINQLLIAEFELNAYHKVTKCVRSCIKTQFTVEQLQSMTIMIEYAFVERVPRDKILSLIYVFSRLVHHDRCSVVPFNAMQKVTNARFQYYIQGKTPLAFVKWFVH